MASRGLVEVEGLRYASKADWRRSARAYRQAIALEPDEPVAYYNLGGVLANSGRYVEAAQRFLEAKERAPVDSEGWAHATSGAFNMLTMKVCDEVVKPEWWNDKGLKALSAKVVRAAPNDLGANQMRAVVLSARDGGAWGGVVSLGSRAQGGSHALRAGCGDAICSGDESKVR